MSRLERNQRQRLFTGLETNVLRLRAQPSNQARLGGRELVENLLGQ